MKKIETVFRKEIKYRISVIQYARIERKLEHILKKDSHGGSIGYRVRSLYFDSIHNQDLHDVLAGLYSKRKIRIRVYSPKDETAKLELKVKHGLDQQKFSLPISKPQTMEMISGRFEFLRDWDDAIAQYIYREMTIGVYRPQVMIEYERSAFISDLNRIRVTFDRNVRGSDSCFDLFSENPNFYPLTPGDTGILEVKYDDFLPSYIKDTLACIDQLPQSNSKYVLGRLRYY